MARKKNTKKKNGEDAAQPVEAVTEDSGEVVAEEETPEVEDTMLSDLEAERDDYKDKWLRAVADQENLRKRTRRDVNDARTFARVDMVRELLDVLDNFERVMSHLPGDADQHEGFKGFSEGVQLVQDRLRVILAGYGLQKLDVTKGMTFDPGNHEAVAQLDSEDVESGDIIDVAQAGYKMGDIIVRPARVAVAK
jgi:molecular chaperone GrpE